MPTLIRMTCPECFMTLGAPPEEAYSGMRCPRCRCRLRRRINERKGRGTVTLRPGTVRLLLGGGISIVLGPVLLAIGIPNLHGRAGMVWARLVAIGAIFAVIGIGMLIGGFVGLYRDLK